MHALSQVIGHGDVLIEDECVCGRIDERTLKSVRRLISHAAGDVKSEVDWRERGLCGFCRTHGSPTNRLALLECPDALWGSIKARIWLVTTRRPVR
jgi:hypothetical protein